MCTTFQKKKDSLHTRSRDHKSCIGCQKTSLES